jgi:hypothetical protein
MVIHAKKKKEETEKEFTSTLFGKVEIKPVVIEDQWESGTNIWTFVNSISEDKNYLFDEHTAKEYTPFTINRAFSIHIDTLHHASVMNQCYNLDKKMQHDYLFYSLPKKVRRKKWLKKSDDEKRETKILEDVARVVGFNLIKTKSFWKVLSETQRKEFLAKYVYPDSKNQKAKQK